MTSARSIPLTLPEIAEAQALARRGCAVAEIAGALSTTVEAVQDALAGKVGAHTNLYAPTPAPRTGPLSVAEARQIGRLADLGTPIEDIASMFAITISRADFFIGEARRKRDREACFRASRDVPAAALPVASTGPRASSDAQPRLPASLEGRGVGSPPLEPSMADLLRPPMPNTDPAARQAEENRLRALRGASCGGRHRRR